MDVDGRQVQDAAIILKYLVTAVGMEFDAAWEDRIGLCARSTRHSLKLAVPASDLAQKKVIATQKLP